MQLLCSIVFFTFNCRVSKNNLFWKITGGIVVLCGGGAAAGAYMYSTNPDFRKFVNKSLPIIETFNLALGPVSNSNNNEKSDEVASMTKVPDTLGTSPKEVVSHGPDFKLLTEIVPKVTLTFSELCQFTHLGLSESQEFGYSDINLYL